jgi:hypothetical protein
VKKDRWGRTSTRVIWNGMIDRCRNPKCPMYPWYGGRGIKVCERWTTFSSFLTDMGERPDGLSLDRINNDGDYEPGNCRWATSREQHRNRSDNHLVTAFGRSMPISAWAEESGIWKHTIRMRLRAGWPEEKAVSTPARHRGANHFSKPGSCEGCPGKE